MHKQNKFDFRCATNFFGEISRIENEIFISFANVFSKMQL